MSPVTRSPTSEKVSASAVSKPPQVGRRGHHFPAALKNKWAGLWSLNLSRTIVLIIFAFFNLESWSGVVELVSQEFRFILACVRSKL